MCVRQIWLPLSKFEASDTPVDPFIRQAGGMYVPCGHCPECLQAKQRQWVARFLLEDRYWKSRGDYVTLFITLTYSPDYITDDPKQQRNDYRAFLKQVARTTGYKPRYYICSEYGSKTKRLHYHVLLFGFLRRFLGLETPFPLAWLTNKIERSWKRGFVKIKIAEGKDLTYVSKYVTKDSFDDCVSFTACSKRPALGLNGITDETRSYLNRRLNNPLRFDYYVYPLPRYIGSKVLNDDYKRLKRGLAVIENLKHERTVNNPTRAKLVWRRYYQTLELYAYKKAKKN